VDVLISLGVQSTYDVKGEGKSNKSLAVIVEPILANLNRLYHAGILDEEQELHFGLICMEAIERHEDQQYGFLQNLEEFRKSMYFRHKRIRKLVKSFVENADSIATVVFAGATGYIWGVARTLWTLRDVTPPSTAADPLSIATRQPYALPQPQPQPRAWRWSMSRKYGGRAAVGAMAFTLWSHLATSTFGTNVWIEGDHSQVAYFSARVMAGVVFAGILFKSFPYFFFPSVMARITDFADQSEDGGAVHITFGTKSFPPSAPPKRPSRGGDDKGQWT
jgi:hypothetical protein